MTTLRKRRRIPLHMLPLPPPGWVNYSKNWLLKKPDIMGPLNPWTAKNISMIPLESNLGCIMRLNRMSKIIMHGESWNDSLMLIYLMFSFLHVGWTTLLLISPTPFYSSKRSVLRSLSCVRYVRTGTSGRLRTPLKMCIKTNWIIQWVSHTMLPVGPFSYLLHTCLC